MNAGVRRWSALASATVAVSILAVACWRGCPAMAMVVAMTTNGQRRSVADRLAEFGAAADARLRPGFAAARLAYPPARVALLAFKRERRLEVYAAAADGGWRQVGGYAVLAASGDPGPKLREGDRQVPEGCYRIVLLNPNSAYHVSLRLDYPNADDRAQAAAEGRAALGGDIMIHGSAVSVGCLAMGDLAAEELFTLVARTGLDRVEVVIAPCDLRTVAAELPPRAPPWTRELYARLAARLAGFTPGA